MHSTIEIKILQRRLKKDFAKFRHITEHTHCVSKPNWKLLASLHRESLGIPSKSSAFVRLEVPQSQHLQWKSSLARRNWLSPASATLETLCDMLKALTTSNYKHILC